VFTKDGDTVKNTTQRERESERERERETEGERGGRVGELICLHFEPLSIVAELNPGNF